VLSAGNLLLPDQIVPNGGFPKELARTKPYSYSIFNFDNMAMLCQSLQRDGAHLFVFAVRNGRDICKGAGAACHWPALPA